VVGLHVRVEHRDDRHPLALCPREVLIDQVDVWVDDSERAVGLAAEDIGGASRLVVQELPEVHACLQEIGITLDKLSSDLLNIKG